MAAINGHGRERFDRINGRSGKVYVFEPVRDAKGRFSFKPLESDEVLVL